MGIDRKEAIKQYKARKTPRGVYAVRCTATVTVWVGSFQNLEAAKNRLWFSLGLGSHRNEALQAEWNAHGEQAFQFEVLEKLDDDIEPIVVADTLKEKESEWLEKLRARPIR